MKQLLIFPIKLLLQLLGWIYCLYLSKIYIKHSVKLKPYFKGQNIFILGSGSSLDEIDLSLIENSSVILLNSTYKRHTELRERGNKLFWFCVDTNALRLWSRLIPSDIQKIVSVHSFSLRNLKGLALSKDDIFLMPKSCFQRDIRCGNFYGLLPKRPKELEEYWIKEENKTIFFPAHTVMLIAILFSASFHPKSITLMGFDVGGAYASNTKEVLDYDKPEFQKQRENIEKSLSFILNNCNKQGIYLSNNSPRTFEKILPKTELYLKNICTRS
ncbi:hypothetical protein [Geminocystis sp. GBBB08]|uniref:hypothetical protein n=1 Tax=Geminocystis sp. GBBB08 TaxID=2604140 RepID=UPI0027E37EB0|nr:hypothetical protein [Geminocystis sp. GBBB08]MBL1209491.1 hypothetical protein [Geminocystis sp. GBBB08]